MSLKKPLPNLMPSFTPDIIDPPREQIEQEVSRRLAELGPGAPGITLGNRLSNGFAEVVYRDGAGEPVGVVGFCFGSHAITDFCVAAECRRRGIASELCDWVKKHLGSVTSLRQPFTREGKAFGDAWIRKNV